MSKLEWNKVGQFWVANSSIKDAAYFIDHDLDTRREGWRSTFTLAREYQLHDTLKAAKQACEDDHNARIDEIARANGYVKLDAVRAELARELKELETVWNGKDFSHIANDESGKLLVGAVDTVFPIWMECAQTVIERALTAAIDAAKEGAK